MTVMFDDIHCEVDLARGCLEGFDSMDLLYAGDSALLISNVRVMSRLLAHIEGHVILSDSNCDKGTCVSFAFDSNQQPKFGNAEKVPTFMETMYLWATTCKHHHVRREILRNLTACLNRLHVLWRKCNWTQKFNINAFDAVIRSRLVCSLDFAQIPYQFLQTLSACALKGHCLGKFRKHEPESI